MRISRTLYEDGEEIHRQEKLYLHSELEVLQMTQNVDRDNRQKKKCGRYWAILWYDNEH